MWFLFWWKLSWKRFGDNNNCSLVFLKFRLFWRIEHFNLLRDCSWQKYFIIKILRMLHVAHEAKYFQCHWSCIFKYIRSRSKILNFKYWGHEFIYQCTHYLLTCQLSDCWMQKAQSSKGLPSNIPIWNSQTNSQGLPSNIPIWNSQTK